MESIIFPLERQVYSWLILNNSRTTNVSYNPSLLPSAPKQSEWLTQMEGSDSFFGLAFQDLSLGFLSLFILQKSFRSLDTLHQQNLSGKWNLRFYDVILTNVLKTIIGILLLVVSLPLVLPVLCMFWVMSVTVQGIYALQFGSPVSKAEGMDGVWGLESKESRPFILISLQVSGTPDVVKIRQHIVKKVLEVRDEAGDYKFKKFRQTFSKTYGYYMWRDVETFEVTDHIRVIDLLEFYNLSPELLEEKEEDEEESKQKKSEMGDKLFHRYLSEESGTALSAEKSPWEISLLIRGDGSYNVVIRLHHAIGDGVSLMRVCMETLVDTPLPPPSVGHRFVSPFIRAAMMVWSAMVLPFGILQVVANFDQNAMHGCPLSGKKIITSSRGIPLPVLKSIKCSAGATVNDVLMSCLSAALSKHFSRRSEEIDQITSVVPVSFHDLSDPVSLTNQFSVATVKLPTSQTYTDTGRLKSTKVLLDGMKKDPTLLAVYAVVRAVSQVLPAPVAELLLSGRGVTVAASNVPGPQQEVSIWGDRVEGIQFWVPNRAPVGVGFSFASFMGVIKVGLNVDAALVHSVEEAQLLLDDLESEVYSLHRKLVQVN